MTIYQDYAGRPVVRVMHPTRRVLLAVPGALLPRYWRAKRPDGADGSWFLPGDDPQWDELVPWVSADHDYTAPTPPALAAWQVAERAAREARKDAIDAWWRAARALAGGNDPLWQYTTDGKDDKSLRAFVLYDESQPHLPAWYPRERLVDLYGTASFVEYASNAGLSYPGGE